MIKVFTRDGCAYCPVVKKFLDIKKVNFEELPAEGDEYMEAVSKFGYTSVPLVVNGDKATAGYSAPLLSQVIA